MARCLNVLLLVAVFVATTTAQTFSCPTTNLTVTGSLTFGQPNTCSRTSCEVYVTMAVNPFNSSYLDIYMEGTAAGWVAVGFSNSQAMENTDVIGCRVDSGSTVSVVDTWNPSPNYSPNQVDDTQDGVCTHSASFTGGRISCLLSRYGAAIDAGRDLDWNTDRYIIFGRRDSTNSGQSLQRHTETPIRTTMLLNAFTDGNDAPTGPTMSSSTPSTTPPSTSDCPTTDKNGEMPFSNLTFGTPTGCSRTSCDVYVTMAPNTMNSSYLDIYMEGTAAGWVAVGFSDSQAMENTDVIGCRVDSGSTVSVVDTWNPSGIYTPNQVDANQDGVCTHSASFTNGRIRCLLSRYAKVVNTNQDLDLDVPRFIIYSSRLTSNGAVMNLQQHTGIPQRTSSTVNPFIGGDAPPAESYPRKQLIQTHGILMLIAWPMLAAVGIFFASWTRPALPNGEWFQTHRALMIGSLGVAIVGFIFAFVANARQSVPGLVNVNNGVSVTHLVFGILVVALQIANPVIALLRCKPDSPNRWIFGTLHAFTIGVGADVLAMINVGLGLVLFHSSFGIGVNVAFWLFIVYLICYLLLEGALHVVFTIVALESPPEDRPKLAPTSFRSCFSPPPKPADEGTEMKTKEDENKPATPQRKPPSKDYIIRWIAVGFLLSFTLLVVVAAILVAAG